jgi:hypothetical protein
MSTSSIIPPAVEQATTPLSPERLAEIRARVEGLDHDRTFNGSAWKSTPVDSKSVLPPQQNFVVEDVLKTSDCVIRASVAVFADESLADFTAHARQDVPALLAEVERLKAEVASVERDVRWSIAEDFSTFGRKHESFNWGEAHLIAREGLCQCRGGSKPCTDGGAA